MLVVASVNAEVPSQSPLLSRDGSNPAPNVMFVIDDSLSMDLIGMPGGVTSGYQSHSSKRRAGYSPDEANARVWKRYFTPTDATNIYAAKLRSAQVNRIYYNPDILYLPWSNSDGSTMANADPFAAWLDPIDQGLGVTDLVTTQNFNDTQRRWCTETTCSDKFYTGYEPDVYFEFAGGNTNDINNYTRVRISDSANFVRSESREDCPANPAGFGRLCTQAQELQNYANWYVYYRTRILMSTAAVTQAFAEQGDGLRVGYGRTNKYQASVVDGVSTQTIERGVRKFSGTDRDDFFDWISAFDTTCCTPLRRAVDDVGKYFKRKDNAGPWASTPGGSDSSPHLSCRKNYSIMVTDGAWTNRSDRDELADPPANGNIDGNVGPLINGENGQVYQYTPITPYKDTLSNRLADVAMYYWYQDLRDDLTNNVKPDQRSAAFWQNVNQFTIGLGVDGSLNTETDLPALVDGSKSWGSNKIDDLWHAAVNGRGSYLSANDPSQLSESLRLMLTDISERDAKEAGAAVSSVALQVGSLKYVPSYRTSVWSGDIQALVLDADGVAAGEVWKASNELPAPSARNIIVSRGNTAGGGWSFIWDQLPNAIKLEMGTGASEEMVNYLRGDRTFEATAPHNFRERHAESVLGDIVNSAPQLIGGLVDEQYQFLPDGFAGRETYRGFLSSKKARQKVLFSGANDGMVHAFNADTGAEVFAMIPRSVVPGLRDLADPNYVHRYYADGPLSEHDAHIGGSWKNILLGSTGAGAKSIYALDVTNPTGMTQSNILWERRNHNWIGHITEGGQVGVLDDGTWVAVFGNGIGSTKGKAALLVLNLQTGAIMKILNTRVGSAANSNGLGGVRLIKNMNNVIVGAYAGDQRGNLWRFDIPDANPANWSVGFDRQPLITSDTAQPIMATPEYAAHPLGGQMVLFGTGRLITDSDVTNTSLNRLYGVWDKIPGGSDTTTNDRLTDETLLVQQHIDSSVGGAGSGYYASSSHPIDWVTDRGWKFDLTLAAGQKAIYAPVLVRGFVAFGTVSTESTGSGTDDICNFTSGSKGYNVLVNILFGTQASEPIYDTNGDGIIDDSDQSASVYTTDADGADALMFRTGGLVSFQAALSSRLVKLQGRQLERIWRQIMNPPN